MTEEQLAVFRSLLEDYDKLADIASNMHWAKTKTKHMDFSIPHSLNESFCISVIGFEKGYVREHFTEAAAQVMMAATTLYETFDADKEWQDDEERRDKLTTYWGAPVWEYLEYKKLELEEWSFDEMTRYFCVNGIYDHEIHRSKDYELTPEAQEALAYFHDVKLYCVGEEVYSGDGGRSWTALKNDTFLWVKYSGLSD